jgi:hypothetical protein
MITGKNEMNKKSIMGFHPPAPKEILNKRLESNQNEVVKCRDDLLKIFFIKDGSDLGNIAHNRKTAHEWLDALLDNLERGEGTLDNEFTEKVIFEFRAMTQKEFDALPEV